MVGLGEMGATAQATAPLLGALIHDTNRYIAGDAIRALGEMGDTGEQYAPEFEKMLLDTNYTGAAAFALARLGSNHVGALLNALTNTEQESGRKRDWQGSSPHLRRCAFAAKRCAVSVSVIHSGFSIVRSSHEIQ